MNGMPMHETVLLSVTSCPYPGLSGISEGTDQSRMSNVFRPPVCRMTFNMIPLP